jgi:hypothetical protein
LIDIPPIDRILPHRYPLLLVDRIVEFAADEDVADEIVPVLLLRLALTTRMINYAASVAKPSGGGLKLDLDRFRRDIEDMVRDLKKNADRFVTHRLMGAGHPRMSFELDTFTAVEPAHFKPDSDWEKRKRMWDGVKVWAIGAPFERATGDFELYQDSSGGENWNSRTHVNTHVAASSVP